MRLSKLHLKPQLVILTTCLPLLILLLHKTLAGAMAALMDGKLILVDASAGSPKFDSVCSLDLIALTSSYSFSTKMKNDVVTLLEGLESWAEKQTLSMDMAQNLDKLSQNFDSLLKVMDSLYQVRACTAKSDCASRTMRQATPHVSTAVLVRCKGVLCLPLADASLLVAGAQLAKGCSMTTPDMATGQGQERGYGSSD